jgi:hypothetical protein
VLNPPAEVRADDELRTGNHRALRGIKLRTGVELYNNELHSFKQ